VTSVKIVNVVDGESVFAVVGVATAEDLREIAAQLLTYASTWDVNASRVDVADSDVNADSECGENVDEAWERRLSDESSRRVRAKMEANTRVERHLAQRVIDPVRGDHYGSLAIQPLDYILANHLDFVAGNVIKYVTRAATTDDVARALVDIRKARHYVDLMERMWASRESEEVRRD
jgi:hypothetical protein